MYFLLIISMILSVVLSLIGFFLMIIMVWSVLVGVPFVPTHLPQAKRMMALGAVGPGKTIIDLGSGAGRILFLAASMGAKSIGYELNPFLYFWTKYEISKRGLKNQVSVRFKSLYKADVSSADIVYSFLFPKPMIKLEPKLLGEMKPGAKIISYAFKMPDVVPVIKEQGIYVYEVPVH
ncbi:MAG: 50S ribosomal protein L11 methyltransferase [Candidatus Magasanikbacteria bacterium]|nr:50S ribosomal protein L11 methyltransferase [Candidatus Magasanikbacteria bacterium]